MGLPEQRRTVILRALEQRGSVTVVDMAERLSVSMMTIRRDLVELEKEGVLRRVHGGAVSARGRAYEPVYPHRAGVMIDEKERIGRAAAELVADGDSIALDVGTTTLELARCLTNRQNMTVVTPSLHVANVFLSQPNVRLVVSGGIARPVEGSLIGELARYAFKRLFVDRVFLGVASVDAQHGISEFNWDDALIKQAMISSAKEVVVLADSSKFSKVAFAHVADFNQFHHLITDREPPEDVRLRLMEAGVQVTIADGISRDE
ncbi:MAG: DeoR/GlpR family DNA-binding transcription regulator [Caldilineaceae bacterium]